MPVGVKYTLEMIQEEIKKIVAIKGLVRFPTRAEILDVTGNNNLYEAVRYRGILKMAQIMGLEYTERAHHIADVENKNQYDITAIKRKIRVGDKIKLDKIRGTVISKNTHHFTLEDCYGIKSCWNYQDVIEYRAVVNSINILEKVRVAG